MTFWIWFLVPFRLFKAELIKFEHSKMSNYYRFNERVQQKVTFSASLFSHVVNFSVGPNIDAFLPFEPWLLHDRSLLNSPFRKSVELNLFVAFGLQGWNWSAATSMLVRDVTATLTCHQHHCSLDGPFLIYGRPLWLNHLAAVEIDGDAWLVLKFCWYFIAGNIFESEHHVSNTRQQHRYSIWISVGF